MTDQIALSRRLRVFRGLQARLSGPGGYYNIGNAFGVVTGLWLHVVLMKATTFSAFFIGSSSAAALTVSMLIFFWSGEMYHRAWQSDPAPDLRLNKLGDVSSGFGALALGVGLLFLGQPIMAATAGLLHAIGKFGSAYCWPHPGFLARTKIPDFWRSLVVLSRVPATLAVCVEIAGHVTAPDGTTGTMLFGPVTLLICYLLWFRADLLLFRSQD